MSREPAGRLTRAFAAAAAERRRALIVYLCAGDPSLAASGAAVKALAAAGADVIELGVPFSDPVADGPTIQAAATRALAAGTTPPKIFALVRELRDGGLAVPLVLMGYLNPIVARGLSRFCDEAAAAGVDGLIVPDLPLDEAAPLQAEAARTGLSLVLLAAPTTTPARLARIGAATSGFLYYVSVTGVTGARAELPQELPAQLAAARAATAVPVAVGFGVSTPEQARELGRHADAVVVGSAVVRALHEAGGDPGPAAELVRALAAALR